MSLDPTIQAVQDRIWATKTPAEKIEMVGRLWLQAQALKRATLRSLHPDWSETELERAVREAMGGRGD